MQGRSQTHRLQGRRQTHGELLGAFVDNLRFGGSLDGEEEPPEGWW